VHLAAEQLPPVEGDRAGCLDQSGDRVDERRLAGTVGPDQEPDVPGRHVEVHPADGDEPVEHHPQIPDAQTLAHAGSSLRCGPA
jgi:hypothetical protein